MDLSKFGGLENIYTGIIIFIIFIRISSILRVAKDISARTNSGLLQVISILLITFLSPIFGLPIYHIIKPIHYKKNKTSGIEAYIGNSTICQNCGIINAKEYKCCINCGKKITIRCKECNDDYPHNYHYCPKCGAPNINLD